ncbi:DUF7263 family protein [Natronomonas sp. EA1]|uniref:DUF7263 family protein n=1 Tax=Natronomonas sp. EA1 TaxID=3421655 RepID=UPI003EB7EC12
MSAERAQANIPALAIALLLLTTVTGVAVTLADGALADGQRDATERAVAVGLAERLVAADAPLTRRGNVLNVTRLEALDAERLEARYPTAGDVRVRVDGETVAAIGEPRAGTTVSRIVLVATEQPTTRTMTGNETTLPRRTDRVRLSIPETASVTTVRANGRVVLHADDGLSGTYTVAVSRFETTTVRHDGGSGVQVTAFPTRARKATLEVTVDA